VSEARLFEFAETSEDAPEVAAWFRQDRGELGALAARWWEVLRGQGEDVREVLHDGQPTACVGRAAYAYVDAFTAHVHVGFFLGSRLPDPAGLLQGSGRWMRHVKLRPGEDLDEAALEALIGVAYENMRGQVTT